MKIHVIGLIYWFTGFAVSRGQFFWLKLLFEAAVARLFNILEIFCCGHKDNFQHFAFASQFLLIVVVLLKWRSKKKFSSKMLLSSTILIDFPVYWILVYRKIKCLVTTVVLRQAVIIWVILCYRWGFFKVGPPTRRTVPMSFWNHQAWQKTTSVFISDFTWSSFLCWSYLTMFRFWSANLNNPILSVAFNKPILMLERFMVIKKSCDLIFQRSTGLTFCRSRGLSF